MLGYWARDIPLLVITDATQVDRVAILVGQWLPKFMTGDWLPMFITQVDHG